MKKISRSVLLAVPLLLAACNGGEMRDTLGLNRNAPDEFTVLSRPPLSVPPEFNLRPPGEGGNPNEVTADEKARGLITGKDAKPAPDINTLENPSTAAAAVPVIAHDAPTPAASTFLKRAGADAASEDIRTQLGNDLRAPVDDSKSKTLYDKLMGRSKADPVVDPKKEAERLRTNKDSGKPVTEGDVPLQDEKSPTVLDRIF
jgi:hypothetical protein